MQLWSDLSTASNALRLEATGQRYKQVTDCVYLGGAISEIADLDTELKRRIGAALASVIRYISNCTSDGTQDYRPRSGFQWGGSGSYTVRMYDVDSPCVCHTPHYLLFILLLSPFPSIVFLPLCGAFVALVLVFLSGLCPTAYMYDSLSCMAC